ncbi:MAG: helix-turn-helix transcriptional regulator [Candidatus Hydrogenedentes bacterium]|nr:helix-turn-helix transcriptional regulator [Candidatus Hydrogenedentota bacterium]
MIQNEREYRITKSQAEKFARALEGFGANGASDLPLAELQRSALASQLDELREQLAEYDALKSGGIREIAVHSLEELPLALIRARIATGLSQKQLAERLGLKEQQIQRYESSAFAGASLHRLQDISGALGLRITGAIHLSAPVPR